MPSGSDTSGNTVDCRLRIGQPQVDQSNDVSCLLLFRNLACVSARRERRLEHDVAAIDDGLVQTAEQHAGRGNVGSQRWPAARNSRAISSAFKYV